MRRMAWTGLALIAAGTLALSAAELLQPSAVRPHATSSATATPLRQYLVAISDGSTLVLGGAAIASAATLRRLDCRATWRLAGLDLGLDCSEIIRAASASAADVASR